MKETPVQIQKWEPNIKEFPMSIFIWGLYDDADGFRVICGDVESDRRFEFRFDNYIAYRNTDEGARLKSLNQFPYNSREWCLYKTHESDFIQWIKEESNGIYSSNTITHYFFATQDDIVEVLSVEEPDYKKL